MAKLLCSLLFAGFVLLANSFSINHEEPVTNDDGLIDRVKNIFPDDLVNRLSKYLPDHLVSKVKGWLPDSFTSFFLNILNPFTHVQNFFKVINPLTYIRLLGFDVHVSDILSYLNPFHWFSAPGEDKCNQKLDKGNPCKKGEDRYYYNKQTKTCTKFTYGGCGGNKNNFKSKNDCDKQCKKK